MTERVIDISGDGARLSVKFNQLVIDRQDAAPVTVPIEELLVLVVAHPAVTFTHAVLAEIAAAKGAMIVCDGKHMPIGMLMPLQAHHVQSERFARQAQASLPTQKRLWQQLIKAKVSAQGRLLVELHGRDLGLAAMADRVRSGDPDNIEGQAARRYWPVLFGDSQFKRNPDLPDQNRLLNYGYAVLRAIVARAACASGLHPALGLHHHNRYDAFPLADDLMEPFRPVVDRVVARLVAERGPETPLDKDTKAALISAVTGRYMLEGESRTLFEIAAHTAASLSMVYGGVRKNLVLPEL